MIDQREIFGKTIQEGFGTSFDLMARWLMHQSRFWGYNGTAWEDGCNAYIGTMPVQDIKTDTLVPSHEISEKVLESLKENNITDEQLPLKVVSVDKYHIIFDGHHRGALAKMSGKETVRAHVAEMPISLIKTFLERMENENK